MNPTIIFDMDGVIVKSEQLWNEQEPAYFTRILKPSIANNYWEKPEVSQKAKYIKKPMSWGIPEPKLNSLLGMTNSHRRFIAKHQ